MSDMSSMSEANDTQGTSGAHDGRPGLTSLLWFEVAGSAMALPVDQVLEIRAPGRYAAVPGAPREVLGLIQHRGRMIPVIDLATRVGGTTWDAESARALGAVVIVETTERGARRGCALAVDRVSGVRERTADGATGVAAGSILDLAAVLGAPPVSAGATADAAGGTATGTS